LVIKGSSGHFDPVIYEKKSIPYHDRLLVNSSGLYRFIILFNKNGEYLPNTKRMVVNIKSDSIKPGISKSLNYIVEFQKIGRVDIPIEKNSHLTLNWNSTYIKQYFRPEISEGILEVYLLK
jgi:hypothetical protein